MFSINFSKANTKFCLSLNYIADNSYLFLNGKGIFKFKVDKKMLTCQLSFVLQVYLRDLDESRDISLKRIVCDFSVDYNSIYKSDILYIQKYLMIKNNMK